MTRRYEVLAPAGFPHIKTGQDLPSAILDCLANEGITLVAGDILVLAQKIVSKAEGRFRQLAEITPGEKALELAERCDKDPRLVQLILDESTEVIRSAPGVLIVRHRLGLVMANAGIDQSNIGPDEGETALLLPQDPDASARQIRGSLQAATGHELGVIINDSFGRPWRLGTTSVCIGSAGVASLIDQRGETDLYGRELKVTQVAVGDELANAATVLMGQADEGRPLAIVRGLDLPKEPASASHLQRPAEEDLFR